MTAIAEPNTENCSRTLTDQLDLWTYYNYQKVLNEYFGIKEAPKKEQTTNQQIYGEIRNLMDTGARRFRMEQEKAKAYQEYIEKQKK